MERVKYSYSMDSLSDAGVDPNEHARKVQFVLEGIERIANPNATANTKTHEVYVELDAEDPETGKDALKDAINANDIEGIPPDAIITWHWTWGTLLGSQSVIRQTTRSPRTRATPEIYRGFRGVGERT